MAPRSHIRKAGKRLAAWLPGLFLFLSLHGQSTFSPYKITIFQDAAQIGSKGIVRFHQQKAQIPLDLPMDAASIDLVTGSDFTIEWFRVLEDSVSEKAMVRNWPDVLKANISRRLTIVYEVGNEFDEISGDVRLVNEKDGLLLLHGTDNSEYFIPLEQVRQVVVPSISDYKIEQKVARRMLEIGLNKDVPFVPMEMFSLQDGLSWTPICRIRIKGSDKAVLQMHAMVENKVADFTAVAVELSASSIRERGEMNSEILDAGTISMKKGESVVINFRETELDYEAMHICEAAWNGLQEDGRSMRFPVDNILQFDVPTLSAFACDMHAVLDENNRNIANLKLSEPGADGKVSLNLGQEKQVRVTFTETHKKSSKKPVKIDDKLFTKVTVEGKAHCYNVGAKFVQLYLTREVQGEISESGKAKISQSESHQNRSIMSWRLPLEKGQKKEVDYKYDALLPYTKE